MTPERIDMLKQAFALAFGEPFEKGAKEVRFLTRSYIGMAKMNPHLERAAAKHGFAANSFSAHVRMDERDFAMIAFFALIGLESACGESALEEPAPRSIESYQAELKKLRGDRE